MLKSGRVADVVNSVSRDDRVVVVIHHDDGTLMGHIKNISIRQVGLGQQVVVLHLYEDGFVSVKEEAS